MRLNHVESDGPVSDREQISIKQVPLLKGKAAPALHYAMYKACGRLQLF